MQTFNASLLTPPQLPPDNINTEQDRHIQLEYEKWLKEQNNILNRQLKYYEGEVLKLRKSRKSLNSKQRQLKKTGGVLTDTDATELTKITQEQTFYQKHLDSARKQLKQHTLVIQDYNAKQQSKIQSQMINSGSTLTQMAPQSPMTIPPSPSQTLLSTSQSPHTNPIQSPSPNLTAQSPGPSNVNLVMQSPSSQQSPYNTMQSSPRIGTPHSQIDENPFSPSSAPSVSPSIPSRLTSPAPGIGSPQSRMCAPGGPMQNNRIITSPIMIQNAQQHQTRFIRPQMINQEQNVRPRNNISQHQQRISYGLPVTNIQASEHQRMLIVQRQRQQIFQQHQQQQQQQPQNKIQYGSTEEKPQPQVTYDRSNVMKVIEAPQFDKQQQQQFYLKPEQSSIQQQQQLYQKAIDSQTINAPSHSSIYVSQSTGLPKQRPQQRKHEVNQQQKIQHEKNQQSQSVQEQQSQEPHRQHYHHQQPQQPSQHQEQQQKLPSVRIPPPNNGEPITEEEFQALVDAGYSVQAIPIHVPVPVEEYQKHIEKQSKRKNSYQYQPIHYQQQQQQPPQPQQQDEQSESYSRPTEYGRQVKGAGKNKH